MARLLRAETHRARALRRAATPAERALWELLRNRRLRGAKFRRQQPIGPYIADFFCEEARLVVEADGAPHFPTPPRDLARDGWLRSMGFTVLRFPNREILDEPEHVLQRIRPWLAGTPPLSPRERGRG